MTDQNQPARPAAPNGREVRAMPPVERPVAPRPVPEPRMERSLEMRDLINHYDNAFEQNQELRVTVLKLQTQLKALEARLAAVTSEHHKMAIERNHYQQAFSQLRAHINEAGTILIQAIEETR